MQRQASPRDVRGLALPVLVAALLDVAAGEPPLRAHPVVWAGRWLNSAGARVPAGPPGRALLGGALGWGAGIGVALAAGTAIDRVTATWPPALRGTARGVALWPLLSGALLLREVSGVEEATGRDLAAGRAAVSRIVSRDTSLLTEEGVRAAALESLAENLSDSVVAPVLWFCVGGLPAAAAYRFANTADAMWGYRSARWEHAGKVAARADDVLNLLPARATALLLAGPRPHLLRRIRREAGRTASPNAGWPMAALALRLDVRLAKEGHYVLNPRGRAPSGTDVVAALDRCRRVIAAGTALVLAGSLAGSVAARRAARAGRLAPN